MEKIISELEKKDKTKQKLEKELSSAKQELVKLEAEAENIKQKLEKSIEILAEEEAKISGFNIEKGSYNSSLEQTENIFTKQQSTASELKNKIKEIEKIEKDIDTNNKILEEKKVSTDLDEIADKIIELESSLERLSQSKTEKDKLLVEINSLKSRLSDNADAEKQLKSGCCPILKEECKNVSGGSASEYFINKADEINLKIEEIKVKIEKDFAKIEEQIKAKNKEISEQNAEKNNTISILKEREKLQAKLNTLFQDKESKKSLLTKVLFANGIQSNPDDYESILKILSDEEQKIKIEINTFSVKIEEINKLLLQSSQVAEKQKKEIDKLKKDISKTDKASGEAKNSIENTEAEIKNLIQALLDFESIKQKKSIINSELEILKPAYEAYTANKKTAESLTKLLKEKEDISFEIIKLGKELESIHSEINSLKDSYSETQLNELMSQGQIIESKLKELHKELIESSTQKAEKQSKLEQNIKLLDEILKMEAEISLLTRKKEIGDKYRANLKEMGRMAAVRMLRRIEIAATENYKMLSGKPETIIWEAGERSYSLKLKAGENNIRSFEMLSGGEQVTIALAMRAALASNLTEANFAIFDEPTINLDNARKSALSDSLQKMPASVKQSIIVTHDKIFEEFAEKVHYIV